MYRRAKLGLYEEEFPLALVILGCAFPLMIGYGLASICKQSYDRAIDCYCDEIEVDGAVTAENEIMKKSVVAVMVVISTLLLCSVSVMGQAAAQSAPGAGAQTSPIKDQDIEMLRADLRQQRKQIMAENMTLTADEATKFWPIFDQYRKEAIKPNDDRWAVIKDYAANYNTMTDAQAQDYMKRSTAVDQQLLALRMKYVPIFEQVISAKKTALWYQIDRRVDLLINLQLSAEIPMVNTK